MSINEKKHLLSNCAFGALLFAVTVYGFHLISVIPISQCFVIA